MRKILLVVIAVALGCGGSGTEGNGTTNHTPVARPSASTVAVVMGGSTQLQAQASDQDGDALTYGWSQSSPASPQGAFSSTTSDSPTWTAPTVGAATEFTLTVTVSDGKGGTGSATLTRRPPRIPRSLPRSRGSSPGPVPTATAASLPRPSSRSRPARPTGIW